MKFDLKKPCENCPFLKTGAIELRPGRLDGIIHEITTQDARFLCHKTVHNGKTGGEWDDDSGEYQPSGQEQFCAGALIYLMKAGWPNAIPRIAVARRQYAPTGHDKYLDQVIDPK